MAKGETNKVLTGIRFPEEILSKMKYISWHDRRTFTQVVEISAEDYVKKWEKANGIITEDQIKQSQKK